LILVEKEIMKSNMIPKEPSFISCGNIDSNLWWAIYILRKCLILEVPEQEVIIAPRKAKRLPGP
jgi:hypothetical protein